MNFPKPAVQVFVVVASFSASSLAAYCSKNEIFSPLSPFTFRFSDQFLLRKINKLAHTMERNI
jgi:hypothetical protein